MSEAVELRKRGLPLEEAAVRFAPRSLVDRYRAPQPETTAELAGGWKILADQAGWDAERRRVVKEGLDTASNLTNAAIASGRLRYEQCSHLLSLLSSKRVVATGFPIGSKDDPEIIPAYLFDNRDFINWESSSVQGNGLAYVNVRVVKLSRSERLLENRHKRDLARQKVGRIPSLEIIGIIRELDRDPAFGGMQRKSQAELVIANAIEKYPNRFPNRKGLSLPTVFRYLHQQLDIEKS